MEAANPFAGMSPGELGMRYPSLYPSQPVAPTSNYIPNPAQDGLSAASPNELAKAFPQFYPDGVSPTVPGLPSAPTPDPLGSMGTPELAQRYPTLYPDAPPVAPLPSNFADSPILPQIPVEASPGASLGDFLQTPVGGGVLTGAIAGAIGLATGEPLETAIGQGVGSGLGAFLGAGAGSIFGPAGAIIGGNLGAIGGGYLGARFGQNIHDYFHPPGSIHPNLPAPREPFPPLTGSRHTFYRVKATGKFKDQPTTNFDNVVLGPVQGVITYSRDGIRTYALSSNGGSRVDGYMSGADRVIDQPVTINSIQAIDGTHDPTTAPPVQLTSPLIRTPSQGVPFGVDFGDPDPRPKPPPSIPHAEPPPELGPKKEKKPGIGIFLNPPKFNPAPTGDPTTTPTTDPTTTPTSTPGQGPQGEPTTTTNINNLPGLMGLPFIPAVMPSNKPSPSGTINVDPGQGPIGTGKPPKAPPNTPCNSACQKAIEGRIQGVDDKIGQILNQGNNAAQDAALAEILRRLAVVDAKLGAQTPGGISGFMALFRGAFDKLTEWLHLDRLLNIMTFIVTLQNAYFLTDSLKIVTLQMISDGLSVLGFHDKDGNGLNLNKLLDKTIEDMLKKVLGVDTLEGMKKEWKALSRIYQAGSNIIYAFQNIAWSILNALDIIGSWNAQIGNALKKYGVVGHNAFAWLNPAPNFHNKFFTAVNNALNIVSNIDFVAQSIIQGRQAVDEITKQSTEFSKDFTEVTNPTPPEHKPTAAAATTATAHSQSPPPTNDDLNKVN